MPDSGKVGVTEQRIGASGLMSGISTLSADPSSFRSITNMITDIPGIAIKRRGIQDLNHTNNYTSLSGLDTSYIPVKAWGFDNHLFVYVEKAGVGAVVAYDIIGGTWQKVGVDQQPDATTTKMVQKTFDNVSLNTSSTGVKRLSALYNASGANTSYTYATAYRPAGVPRALDPRCRSAVAGSGTDHGLVAMSGYEWMPPTSAVSYRICWIYRDENGKLLTGAPSGRIIVRNLSTTTSYTTRLKIVIPSGLTSTYVMQTYRTGVQVADATGFIPDPGDDQFLCNEYQITSTDVANGYVLFQDISVDQLLGDALYTNANQEGPDQARFQPPIAKCLERFGNCAFFGNITDRQRLIMKMLAVDTTGAATGIRIGDRIIAGDLTMEAVASANEENRLDLFAIDPTTGAGSEVVRAIKTAESFVYKYNQLSNKYNGRYSAFNLTTDNDVYGVIEFEEKSPGGGACYLGLSRYDTPTSILPFPGVSSPALGTQTSSKGTMSTNGAGTLAGFTPTALVVSYAVGDKIVVSPYGLSYAAGTTSPKFVNTGVPAGIYTITATGTFAAGSLDFSVAGLGVTPSATDNGLIATTGGFIVMANSVSTGLANNARSQSPLNANRLWWSASREWENAPILNNEDIGSPDAKIQALVATVTSMFILKEDGIWRLTGTDGDWNIESLDPATKIVAPNSAAVVDGSVYALSNGGIVKISDGGVTKISTEIGLEIDDYYRRLAADPLTARDIEGVGHAEDHAYMMSFPQQGALNNGSYPGPTIVYRYHVPSKHWTKNSYSNNSQANNGSSTLGIGAMCTVKATRYDTSAVPENYIERLVVCHRAISNSIGIERRSGQFSDYCDYDMGYQVASSYTTATGVINFGSSIPSSVRVGDVVWAVVNAAPGTLTYRAPIIAVGTNSVTIATGGAIPALSTWPAIGLVTMVFMQQIDSSLAYMPFLANKGFSNTHASDLTVQFGSQAMFGSASVQWFTDLNSSPGGGNIAGFGYAQWENGLLGLSRDAITLPATRSMTCIAPQNAQRGAYIQITISHGAAWEPFDVCGIQLSMFGEAKVRKGNGA